MKEVLEVFLSREYPYFCLKRVVLRFGLLVASSHLSSPMKQAFDLVLFDAKTAKLFWFNDFFSQLSGVAF